MEELLQEQFLKPDKAIQLNDLQYNEPCFAFYTEFIHDFILIKPKKNSDMLRGLTAPTYQQATDWFRKKYGIVLDVFQQFDEAQQCYTGKWEVDVSQLNNYKDPHIVTITQVFDDYYVAWDTAIRAGLIAIKLL